MSDKQWQIWKVILWLIILYAFQHLIRDILADILDIHNFFTEILHRDSSAANWCRNFCQYTTFPIEIFYLISSIYLLKKRKFGWLGWAMLVVILPVLLQYFDIIK